MNAVTASQMIALENLDTVKAYVDLACRADGGALLLLGWVYDVEHQVRGFCLSPGESRSSKKKTSWSARLLQPGVDGVHLIRLPRPDVVEAMSAPEALRQEPFGFLLVVPKAPSGAGLALALDGDRYARLPFVAVKDAAEIRQQLVHHGKHAGEALLAGLRASVGVAHPLFRLAAGLEADQQNPDNASMLSKTREPAAAETRFHIECAIRLNQGLILVGWAATEGGGQDGVSLHLAEENGREQAVRFGTGHDGSVLIRSFRPDLKDILPSTVFGRGMHGFVFHWPLAATTETSVSIRFDGCSRSQDDLVLLRPDAAEMLPGLRRIWIHAGNALLGMAAGLQGEPQFAALLGEIEAERNGESSQSFASCDHALLLNNGALILNGWIARSTAEIERVELVTPQTVQDITSRLVRYMRPDLIAAYPWSGALPLGFLAVLEEESALACDARLRVVCRDGQTQVLRPQVQVMDWAGLAHFINHQVSLALPLLARLAGTRLEDDAGRLAGRIAWLRRGHFQARRPHLTQMVEQPETVIAAIDRTYTLGEAGVLIFGWHLMPRRKPRAILVRNADGESMAIGERMVPVLRPDVAHGYRPRFPEISDWSGFVCLVPMPTRPGEARALCYDFGDLGEVWLQVPTEAPQAAGVGLIKQMLASVPAPDSLRNGLYELFSRGLGHAVEAVSAARPPFEGRVEVRQYGVPASSTAATVIVPLYGRYDFMRHQLAQFVDDPDFAQVDLIYVVDDPAILAPTLELAAKYHALFDLPFRVVWYGQNRGFAGANNIGASLARGDCLVLLNSDVIPQQPGWLTGLKAALDSLPDAGAVGPLLQFGDGTVQHAGMYPRRDDLLPGFLLNTHKGMGTLWHGGQEAVEAPMLTAACLMLRTRDYLELGGLDEGYIVGDFEDSDLCLALRKMGKRVWLAPGTRLWHVERQSQTLADGVGMRQMLTLFNGWRYNEKIRAGLLADPTQVEQPE